MSLFAVRKLSRILACLSVLLAASSLTLRAEEIGTSFVKVDPSRKYRIVPHYEGFGSVCIGAKHGSQCIVYCLTEEEQPTADCYWYVESRNGKWAFCNAETGDYLTFTPAKDYTTYTRLLLTPEAQEESWWTVGMHQGRLNFSFEESSVDYFINVSLSSRMVEASKDAGHSANSLFELCDSAGQAVRLPVYTPFAQYADSLRFDGKLVPFDGTRFLFPVPEARDEASDYAPLVEFVAADGEAYSWLTQDAGGATAQGAVFSASQLTKPFTLTLCRNGEQMCRASVVFTNHPVVEVSVEDADRETYRRGSIRLTDRKAGSVNGKLAADLRYRGATTAHYPKKSFNVKLVQADGTDLDSAMLGIRPENSWILDAMAIDRVRMRNRLLFDLWNRFSLTPYATDYGGRNGTVGQFVEVILNGEYNGLYCMSDKIDRKLLNLKKPKMSADGSQVTVRGLLYKSNSWDHTGLTLSQLDTEEPMDTDEWNNWELQVPDDYPSEDTWNPLLNLYEICSSKERFVQEFGTAFYRYNVIDFYVFTLAFNMTDNGNKNLFLSTPDIQAGSRFLFTPWDMDATIGGYYDGRYYGGTYDELEVADARINRNNPFHQAWSTDVDGFRADMAARWFELRDGQLSPDSVNALFERYASEHVAFHAWEREVERWTDGTPIVDDLNEEIKYLEDWYLRRCAKMDGYFSPYSGIGAVSTGAEPCSARHGVFSLTGVKLSEDPGTIETLPRGLYVVDGSKVVR